MGFVRHRLHLTLYRMGCLRSFEAVDWNRVRRLVFVCKGNICRSPYAEAKARAVGMSASSFGLQATVGGMPNAAATEIARHRGVDLSEHRARRSEQFPLIPGDLLMAMEPWHARALKHRLCTDIQLTLVGLWCHPPRPHIEDPYGLSESYFESCFSVIDDAIARIQPRMPECDT